MSGCPWPVELRIIKSFVAGGNRTTFLGWVTLTVALSTCAIVGFALQKSPRTVTAKELEDRRVEFDPEIGRKFQLGSVDGARVVIALGDCLSCSVLNTDFNDLKSIDTSLIAGVYRRGADSGAITKDYEWFTIWEDREDLHTRLNAFFSPRAYVFGKDGKLLQMQKPGEPLKTFLARSKKEL